MATAEALRRAPAARSDHRFLLTLGFGTTVSMWFIGYLCRIPPVWVPSWLLLLLLLAALGAGGFLAGRLTGGGWLAGTQVGVVSSVLNMLILGSLLSSTGSKQVVPSALWWAPGSMLAGAVLGSLGALTGGRFAAGSRRRPTNTTGLQSLNRAAYGMDVAEPFNWTASFAWVAAGATWLLLIVGGVVTSESAGLSVVDWPTSFGYNMFLYPLARMTGGIYFEHAHRLFGSLVGLTTLVLAVHLFRVENRRSVRWYGLALLGLVIVQGILGGLRVTGHFTSSTSPADTRPNILLAIAHGVTGQLFFGALVALGAFTSTTWRSRREPTVAATAGTDQSLTTGLVAALIAQLVLGAVLRHISRGLPIHITMAGVVTVLAGAAGARAAMLPHGQPILRRLGRVLLTLLGCQLALGMIALAVRGIALTHVPPPAYTVVLRTAHQACGAVLLASAVLLMVWSRRLLRGPAAV